MQNFMEMLKTYIMGIKRGDKKLSKNGMLILFLSGILLYIILLPIDNNTSYEKKNPIGTGVTMNTGLTQDSSGRSYKDMLEEELEEFLEQVDGVGATKVLIYLDTSEEMVVEKDNPVKENLDEENQSDGTKSLKQEKDIGEETVYTVNSNGDEVPFIAQTKTPRIAGVVIAAQGADNETIKLRIIKTTMALYGIEANKIDVLSMKNN